jgi:hypothetical protein
LRLRRVARLELLEAPPRPVVAQQLLPEDVPAA